MNFRIRLGILVLSMFITAPWFDAFAQDPAAPPIDSAVVASIPQVSTQNEINMQWVWGEVVSLDSQAKTIILKYLDYETDQEKELTLVTDEKTTYENIKGFDEIKVKDILSIDYAVGPENKNVAKNINLEKPDALPPAKVLQPGATMDAPAGSSTAVTETPPPAAPVAADQAQ